MSRAKSFLFYYGASHSLSGGPRTALSLFERLDSTCIRPVFVSQAESPLSERLLSQGCSTIQLPLPAVLAAREGKTLAYSVVDKLRSINALIVYNGEVERIGRRHQIAGIWGRNTKSVVLTGIAAANLGVPLVWDIGLEKESRGLMRILHWISLQRASVVVTQAKSQPAQIFGATAAKLFASKFISIVPGIDVDRGELLRNARKRRTGPQEEFRIVSIGTIHPRKNQLMLIRAIRELVGSYPHIRVELVGPVGDAAYMSLLDRAIKDANLGRYVTFTGWRDDIPELMAQSDLVVLCSHNEGIPHVVREAMWAELPVIATTVGGVPEMIEHGQTGFLVARDDSLELGQWIVKCLTQPELRYAVAERARQFAEHQFSITTWAAQYNHLLRRLVQHSAVGSNTLERR